VRMGGDLRIRGFLSFAGELERFPGKGLIESSADRQRENVSPCVIHR